MKLAKFRKSPGDRKRYEVNYEDWLNESELLTSVTMEGNVEDDAFYVEAFTLTTDKKEVVFYISGGVTGSTYEVGITVATSLSQIKEDTITFVVV